MRRRRTGRLTEPEPETVSAAEFEEMKRDLEIEPEPVGRGASTVTRRLLERRDRPGPAAAPEAAPRRKAAPARAPEPDGQAAPEEVAENGQAIPENGQGAPSDGGHAHAPDVAENEGVAPVQKPKRPAKSRPRNRKHGRRR